MYILNVFIYFEKRVKNSLKRKTISQQNINLYVTLAIRLICYSPRGSDSEVYYG